MKSTPLRHVVLSNDTPLILARTGAQVETPPRAEADFAHIEVHVATRSSAISGELERVAEAPQSAHMSLRPPLSDARVRS